MPPQQISNEERRFRLFLQSRGLRVTEERMKILRAVMSSAEHLQADELADMLRKDGANVSRATVYRTLVHLVDAGLVYKVDFGEGHAHYEDATKGTGHHDHIKCEVCNTLIEFFDSDLEAMQERIAQKYNFRLTGHQFQLFGICENCRNIHKE